MMNRKKLLLVFAIVAGLCVMNSAPAIAQDMAVKDPSVKATFVHLGNGEPGVLYEPMNPGTKAQIAIFAMHTANDFLTHSSCMELSKRGYRLVCANDSNSKSGEFNDGILDKVLLQAKVGIVYLRKYPGVKKIILWGHSGGATIMTAYQNIAENGVKVCQDPAKIVPCPNSLAGLPPPMASSSATPTGASLLSPL